MAIRTRNIDWAFALCLWIIGFFILLVVVIKFISTELAITNKRVIAKFGFIRRNAVEINLAKIESIQVHQGIVGRIFNFGSVVLSGAGNPQAPIPGISDPLKFRQTVIEAQERATFDTGRRGIALSK